MENKKEKRREKENDKRKKEVSQFRSSIWFFWKETSEEMGEEASSSSISV